MTYSKLENVNIIVALLKAYGIQHIVLSPGNRNIPLVWLVEHDDYFKTYSVVDERSAGFFAIGLIQRLNRPVAICCTSGTAVSNYASPVSEAFYQHLPLVVLSADRNNYFLNQNEDQMVPQVDTLKSVCKMSVHLPAVRDKQDYWYCKNRVDAALLEVSRRTCGPVHINFTIENGAANLSDAQYEKPAPLARLHRYEMGPAQSRQWKQCAEQLMKANIMIVYGQSAYVSEEEVARIHEFAEKYNCVIAKEHISNLHCDKTVNLLTALRLLSASELDRLMPDIVITMNGNVAFMPLLKNEIAKRPGRTAQWLVVEDGEVRDSLRCLNSIFECSSQDFFSFFAACDTKASNGYYDRWESALAGKAVPNPQFSSLYAVKALMEGMPENSVFHIANSSSIRYANMFPLKPSIRVYCNRGTNGIDGCFSAFMGNAAVSEEPAFLLIGDLSFFYDLNACWNRYSGKNIRIMLNNNAGAELFHYDHGTHLAKLNEHTAAEHRASAKGWIESMGFCYLSARTQAEFDENLGLFLRGGQDRPVLFEVFTEKDADALIAHKYYNENASADLMSASKKVIKQMAQKSGLLSGMIEKARR